MTNANSDLTLARLREAKAKLESTIREAVDQALQDFTKETNLAVVDVNVAVKTVDKVGVGLASICVGVSAEVEPLF